MTFGIYSFTTGSVFCPELVWMVRKYTLWKKRSCQRLTASDKANYGMFMYLCVCRLIIHLGLFFT